jgi:hypothetical protein
MLILDEAAVVAAVESVLGIVDNPPRLLRAEFE